MDILTILGHYRRKNHTSITSASSRFPCNHYGFVIDFFLPPLFTTIEVLGSTCEKKKNSAVESLWVAVELLVNSLSFEFEYTHITTSPLVKEFSNTYGISCSRACTSHTSCCTGSDIAISHSENPSLPSSRIAFERWKFFCTRIFRFAINLMSNYGYFETGTLDFHSTFVYFLYGLKVHSLWSLNFWYIFRKLPKLKKEKKKKITVGDFCCFSESSSRTGETFCWKL